MIMIVEEFRQSILRLDGAGCSATPSDFETRSLVNGSNELVC